MKGDDESGRRMAMRPVTIQKWLGTWLVAMVTLMAMPAAADDAGQSLRVVVAEVSDGSERVVEEHLDEMAGLEFRSFDWFADEVQARAFNIDGILDNPDDLSWVMDGSDIDLIIDIVEEDEQDYRIRFITADDAEAEHEFLADRGHEGAIRRGGATVIRVELETFLGRDADRWASAVAAADDTDDGGSDDKKETDDDEDVAPVDLSDPQAMRAAAAADDEELQKLLSRDWLWLRAHLRMFQKDVSVAAENAVFTHSSGGFFGFELDVEAFPFGQNNPELMETGFYATYNHGFYGMTVTEGAEDEEPESVDVSVNNLTIEGGALYRLDSPLEDSHRQLRFKLGGRYDSYSLTENPAVPSMSMISLVLGTRLVLPVGVEEFAVTAGLDVSPVAFFGAGADIFGADSFSYGFGSELGFIYEVMDNGFLSAGYSFRLMRSDFSDAGDPIDEDSDLVFTDSEVFDLNHGMRAGFVYQY